jgi:hypothetical protein
MILSDCLSASLSTKLTSIISLSLQAGRRHGEGTMLSAIGHKYEGGWCEDKYHGFGRQTLNDGTVVQVGREEERAPLMKKKTHPRGPSTREEKMCSPV